MNIKVIHFMLFNVWNGWPHWSPFCTFTKNGLENVKYPVFQLFSHLRKSINFIHYILVLNITFIWINKEQTVLEVIFKWFHSPSLRKWSYFFLIVVLYRMELFHMCHAKLLKLMSKMFKCLGILFHIMFQNTSRKQLDPPSNVFGLSKVHGKLVR